MSFKTVVRFIQYLSLLLVLRSYVNILVDKVCFAVTTLVARPHLENKHPLQITIIIINRISSEMAQTQQCQQQQTKKVEHIHFRL